MPADLAALARPEAERLAREAWKARNTAHKAAGLILFVEFDEQHDGNREALLRAHVALLLDFSRPASRDHWVRWGIERDIALWDADAHRVPESIRAEVRLGLVVSVERVWHALRDDADGLRLALLAVGGGGE